MPVTNLIRTFKVDVVTTVGSFFNRGFLTETNYPFELPFKTDSFFGDGVVVGGSASVTFFDYVDGSGGSRMAGAADESVV